MLLRQFARRRKRECHRRKVHHDVQGQPAAILRRLRQVIAVSAQQYDDQRGTVGILKLGLFVGVAVRVVLVRCFVIFLGSFLIVVVAELVGGVGVCLNKLDE